MLRRPWNLHTDICPSTGREARERKLPCCLLRRDRERWFPGAGDGWPGCLLRWDASEWWCRSTGAGPAVVPVNPGLDPSADAESAGAALAGVPAVPISIRAPAQRTGAAEQSDRAVLPPRDGQAARGETAVPLSTAG